MKFYIFADHQVTACTTVGNIKVPSYDWKLIHAPENFPTDIYGSPINDPMTFAYNISMSKELGRAGSLTFTIPKGHPEYNNIIPLGTTIALTTTTSEGIPTGGVPDGEHAVIGHVLWFGRVVTIEKTFNLEMNVTCEGALAFLNDIMVRPRQFYHSTGDDQNKLYQLSAIDLLDMILGEYNASCQAHNTVKRQFVNVEITAPQEQIDETYDNILDTGTPVTTYTDTNGNIHTVSSNYSTMATKVKNLNNNRYYIWNTSKWEEYYGSAIQGYNINATTFTGIDDYVTTFDKVTEIANIEPTYGVIAECYDDIDFDLTLRIHTMPNSYNPSHIVFANNLTDLADNGDGMDVYTSVIPFGANKIRLNEINVNSPIVSPSGYKYWLPTSDYIGSTTASGYIEKTVDFSDCQTRQELQVVAEANYQAYVNRTGRSFNVSAVDLSILNENFTEGYTRLIIQNEDIWAHNWTPSDPIPSDFNANNFINCGDSITIIDNVHGVNYSLVNFVCSSLNMDVDNPGATNYVFQVYDSNYIPLNPKMLTAYYDKQRAISEGKIAKDGTIYRAAQEANAVYREDDNTVYAYYDDHEKKYTATGSGDVREQIVEEDLAPGTTPLPNNNS